MLASADKRLFTSGYLQDVFGGDRSIPIPSRLRYKLPVKAGLQGWYDAADTATITDAGSGAVSAWADKSGNGYDLAQSTSGSRPTTGTRTLNGRNVVDFDGSADHMTSSLPNDDRTSTTFVVGLTDALGAHQAIFGGAPGGGSGSHVLQIRAGSGAVTTQKDNIAHLALDSTPDYYAVTAGSPFLIGDRLTATHVLQMFPQAVGNTMAYIGVGTATFDSRTFALGAQDPGVYFNGYIAELIRYSDPLSFVDCAKVIEYLYDKWGL